MLKNFRAFGTVRLSRTVILWIAYRTLRSGVWCDTITANDLDWNYRRYADENKSHHVADVAKLTLLLAVWLLVEEEVYIDPWRNWYYGERL